MTCTYTYIHWYDICIYIYTINIYTQVTWSRFKCCVLIPSYWLSPSRTLFCERIKWFSISKYSGRGQGHNNLNCPSTSRFFWKTSTPKKTVKILANTFSNLLAILRKQIDLVAILRKQISYGDYRFPSHSHNCVWVRGMTIPVPFP